MTRYLPPHPAKGSPEAFAWARKMAKARRVRTSGKKMEARFFGKGGPLEVKRNPERGWRVIRSRVGWSILSPTSHVVDGPEPFKEDVLWISPSFSTQDKAEAYRLSEFIKEERKKFTRNPGAHWHEEAERVATRYRKTAPTEAERLVYAGMSAAHKSSASAARKMGMNPSHKKNPIAVFGLGNPGRSERYRLITTGGVVLACGLTKAQAQQEGQRFANRSHMPVRVERERAMKNPPREVRAKIAGTVYNRVKEVRAEKTHHKPGLYKHPFKSGVKLLALDNGDLLIHSTTGKKLWQPD